MRYKADDPAMLRVWVYNISIYLDKAWTYLPEKDVQALARWLLVRFVVTLTVVIGSAVVYMTVQIWSRNDEVPYELVGNLLAIYILVFAAYILFGTGKFAIRLSHAIRNIFGEYD
jgi:hypothetical protein